MLIGEGSCNVNLIRGTERSAGIDLIEVDAASKTKVDDTRDLLDNVQYAPARGRFKVYLIDEVHMLVGAGSAGSSVDAANILKPALSRGEITCIGATTVREYRKYVEKDAALERRFQPITVDPPTVDETGTYRFTGLPDGEETVLVSDVDDDRRELGLYVDLSYRFTERLQGSIGARWYDLRRRAHEVATGLFADPNLPVATREFENDGINGKATLSYKLTDDALLYALVSEGFRLGGANEQAAAFLCDTEQTFDSDSIVNFEVGAKMQFFGDRMVFNTALYHAKWDDAQLLVQPRCGFSVGINSGGVTAEGVEIETAYVPNDRWELSFNVGYMNPTLDNDVPDIGAPAGRRLSNVPDVTASFSSTYRFPALGGRQGFARADIQHVGSIYTEIGNVGRPRIELDPYTLVNLRTGIEGDRWRITVFADNVFDEQATALCCRDNGEFTINRPRTIGIRARYSAD